MAAKKKEKKEKLSPEEKRVARLHQLTEEINDAIGAEGKVYLGRDHEEFERIPTDVLAFDALTGGGLPRRHYTELYGEYGSGKTTLALRAVAAVQRRKGIAAWVVGEEFNDDWAEANGVDLDRLVKIEALTGDRMLEVAASYLEEDILDLLVFDSVQAIGTARESEGGVESESYAGGGAPQLWGRMYRRTRGLFNARLSRAAIIGISQVRAPIGVFSKGPPPNPRPTQIKAILHWKAISIMCKKGEAVYKDPKSEKKRMISREFNLQCKKNKTAGLEDAVSSYVYRFKGEGRGIDAVEEVFRAARQYDLIARRGAILEGYGIKVKGTKEMPAEDAYKEKLRKRPSVVEELRTDALSLIVAGE